MKAVFAAALAVSFVTWSGTQSAAQSPGERMSGTIADLQLGYDPPRIQVRLDSGRTVTVYVDGSTRISMPGRRNAAAADLREQMTVSFEWPGNRDDVIRSLQVDEGRGGSGGNNSDPSYSSGSEELKVRILAMNPRRGEFEADVAGRRRQFAAEDASMLRNFEEGDLAVITVRRQGSRSVVTNIRAAGSSGRVVDVDSRHGEIVISVDGRERTYTVERTHLLDDIRRGDRIRFEVEDRSNGRKVITSIY